MSTSDFSQTPLGDNSREAATNLNRHGFGIGPMILLGLERVPMEETSTAEQQQQLVERLGTANDIEICLGDPSKLTHSHLALLNHIGTIAQNRTRFRAADGSSLTSPLAAIVPSIKSLAEDARGTYVTSLIQIGAAWFADNPDRAITEVRIAIKSAKCRIPLGLEKGIRRAVRRIKRSGSEQQRIADLIDSEDIDTDLYVPRGWYFDCDTGNLERIDGPVGREECNEIRSLIFIQTRATDVATGQEYLELCWVTNGNVHRRQVQRQQLMTTRGVVELSSIGIPVNSLNSSLFITYFDDCLRDNEFRLPHVSLSRQLGWINWDAAPKFLLGGSTIESGDSEGGSSVRIDGSDPAIAQIASAYQCNGEAKVCRDLLAEVAACPIPWIAFLTSLSSVLLRPLGIAGFVLDLAGQTSTGKSTTLKITASIWGDPNGRCGRACWHSWSLTRVFVERAAAILQSLPLLLDDTRQVTDERLIASIVYDLANGQSRGRGNQHGIDARQSWTLNTISTGERSLVSYGGELPGMRARILSFRGAPIPDEGERSRQMVERWVQTAQEHYGHVGQRFLQWIVNHHNLLSEWRSRIATIERELSPRFARNAVAGRHLPYLALLTLTAELCCEIFDLPVSHRQPIDAVQELLQSEYADGDRPREALERVLDHVHANDGLMGHLSNARLGISDLPRGPSHYIGRRLHVRGDLPNTMSLAIYDRKFEPTMTELGFNADEIITAWHDKGYLHSDSGRKLKNVTHAPCGGSVRAVVIKASVIEQIEAERQQSGFLEGTEIPAHRAYSGAITSGGNGTTT